MAIITNARMQQLRGEYADLNKDSMLPGEIAVCDDHNPIVRTNTGFKEMLTADDEDYYEKKIAEVDKAIQNAKQTTEDTSKQASETISELNTAKDTAISDMQTATADNTSKVDTAIEQLNTDKAQAISDMQTATAENTDKVDKAISGMETNTSKTISDAVASLEFAKNTAVSEMETVTKENTDKVDKALDDISLKIGIDDENMSVTTTYSSDKIEKLFAAFTGGVSIKKVDELPTEDIDDKTIYFLKKSDGEEQNVYYEYMYLDGKWELFGDTKVDLSDYYTKSETAQAIKALIDDVVASDETTYSSNKVKALLEDVTDRIVTLEDISHTHDNKSTLDLLSQSDDGNLLFNGEEIKGGGGVAFPPKNPTSVSIKASDETLKITWVDPEDNIVEGTTLASWGGTQLYISDHEPTEGDLGTLVVDNTVRNAHAIEPVEINELTNNKLYYIYFVPYTTAKTYGYSTSNLYTAKPAKVLLDDVTDIEVTSADKSLTVKWTNPAKSKTQDDVTATWVKTTVVVKADGYPANETDGIAYASEDYDEGEHEFEVENGKDYFVRFFIESDLGSVKETSASGSIATYATLTITTDEETLYGKGVEVSWTDGDEENKLTSAFSTDGKVTFKIPYMGTVTIYATDGEDEIDDSYTVTEWGECSTDVAFYIMCGFHYDGNESDPASIISYDVQYNGKNVKNKNYTPAYTDLETTKFVPNDWEKLLDKWLMPRPCLLAQNGTVFKYLDPDDYTKDVDGNDVTSYINGTTGTYNVMVEWGKNDKKIWYKIVPDDGDETSATIYIADKQADDGFLDYPFHNANSESKDHFYMSAYFGSVVSNTMRSISGKTPMASYTATQEVTYAQANNQGSNKEWYIEQLADRLLVNMLLLLIGKNTDTQATFGNGNSKSYSSSSNTGIKATGVMNQKGMFYGDSAVNFGVKVFGIENYWASQFSRLAGDILNNTVRYVKFTWGTEDGSTTTGYNETGTGYLNLGATYGTSGYMTKLKFTDKGFFSSVGGGTETTYLCDYATWKSSQVDYCIVGGNSSLGSYCGAFTWYLNYLASIANWSFAARLSCKPLG